MICVNSDIDNPFFNLASEEYLLKNKKEDVFLLWVGTPSIIVGKHQNTLGEINYNFTRNNGIDVARRLSGGGTVYHDEGNLNFTWIMNGELGKLVDFKKFINPIIDFLNDLNLHAEYGGRNDIIIQNKKVSGNAEHVYKNRTLHHGTLLFNSNLKNLRSSLEIDKNKYTDKAVKSVPHPVGNISNFLKKKMSFDEFRSRLFTYILKLNKKNTIYNFKDEEINLINRLKKEKYETWNWNFGYSPKYSFRNFVMINHEESEISFEVSKGILSRVNCKHLKNKLLRNFIENSLENSFHHEEDIIKRMHESNQNGLLGKFDIESFVKRIF